MRRWHLLAWLGAALVALHAGAVADDERHSVLRDEDVVRMHVSGTSAEELIRRIQSSDVEFDTTDEMLDELRLAGVPQPVIQAMVARQRELRTAREPPPEEAPVAPQLPRLTIRLGPVRDSDTELKLRFPDRVPPGVAEGLGLDATARITNLAILLACRTADHVPDHWRSKSPLGRDFLFMPRHRLLAFVAGVEPPEAGDDDGSPKQLELGVPETIEAELEPGVIHDLTLGIAIEIGGRYYLAAGDERDNVVLDESLDLEAVIAPGSPGQAPEVRFPAEP